MSDVVIKVEGVSKQYRLGKIGTGTFSHDLNRWWHTVRGKEDPYLKIGEVNDRSKKGESEYVWALKDISFDVKQGDVLGIIGKNGAGKSTLLKILSRTTLPTTGSIKIKGRVASLLEVGTGFHPELTGRENIFLNGAILGMRKWEIKKKFDEIVDFSGVEKYIDTPVKRYSSGMYVRLAFAVAAHLEPEILIVDEVLAVGDAEFQKKALGKMKDVSQGQGRTVLFVSHNMAAIRSLCNSGLLLEQGSTKFSGDIGNTLTKYIQPSVTNARDALVKWDDSKAPGNNKFRLVEMSLCDDSNNVKTEFLSSESILIKIKFKIIEKIQGSRIVIQFMTSLDEVAFASTNHEIMQFGLEPGVYESTCKIPPNILNTIRYYIRIHAGVPGQQYIFKPIDVFYLDVLGTGHHGSIFNERWPGAISPTLDWTLAL